jgi:O-acetyl-ADP-ribose deacetylase (regulator of RNase III)
MPNKYVTGDLFATHLAHPFSGIAHGCNLLGSMGAGIAAQFKAAFPDMYTDYKMACARKVYKPGDVMWWPDDSDPPLEIFNMFTQDRPGPCAKLEWVEAAIQELIRQAEHMNLFSIGMPMIGCGIGGLAENDVVYLLEKYASETVTLVIFEKYVPNVVAEY